MDYVPHGLTYFDYAVIIVVLLSAFSAFFRGFCKELFTLLALIGAIILSSHFSYLLNDPVKSVLPNDMMANAVAKIGAFLLAALVLGFIGKILAYALQRVVPPSIDRTLGVLFGIARGFVLIFIPFFFTELYLRPDAYPVWLNDAKTKPYFEEATDAIKQYLPPDYKNDHDKADKRDVENALEPARNKADEVSSKAKGYGNKTRHELDELVYDSKRKDKAK